ncbi:MAG: hypothetical protein FJ272_10725 [Planctomycetes bacterium]|nr:hypothetical protein [Planctomycetota bacterium]
MPKDLPWLRGGDDRYVEPFMDGVMKAVRQAKESLRPVRMRAVRGMDGRVAFNRRFILRDGTVRTHGPLCSPDVLCCEGPVDPEVGMVVFESESGEPVAALLHHTCHPVHGYPQRYICPDWPGLWPAEVSKLLGGQCVALVANGACGNVHHTNHLDPTYRADVHRFVACLTETAKRILPGLKPVEATPLKWASRTLRIPMRTLPPEEVSAARKLLSDHPEPMWASDRKDNIRWDWVYALATLDLARQLDASLRVESLRQERQSWYDYEIQALRVGGLALIAWPGEPFVEAQLEVKKNSPAAHTFVAHMSNDSAGYQPTREAFQRGGYETRTANWSKLDPCALEMVTAESKAMLGQLFA